MDQCTCELDTGGDGLTLWLIVALRHSGRVLGYRPKPHYMRADVFIDEAREDDALYRGVAPGTLVTMRYAHSMECLRERNPGYSFPVPQPA